jgi:hypothetical protein
MLGAMGTGTRFRPRHRSEQLLLIVRDVCIHADPERPHGVSQPRFDEARASACHPDSPRAHKIAERLGVFWAELLHAVFDAARPAAMVAVHASDRTRKGFALDDVVSALRMVANHVGASDLSRADYTRGREALVAADARAWAHGGQATLMLPTLNQLDEVLARNELGWPDALAAAGLGRVRHGRAGMTVDEAVAAFALDTGCVPATRVQLERWRLATGHALNIQSFSAAEVKAAVLAFNSAQEEPLPPAPRAMSFAGLVSKTPTLRTKWPRGASEEQFIAGLVRAIGLLLPGERLTQDALRRITKAHPHELVPSWQAVVNGIERTPGASWAGWRDEAIRRHARSRPVTAQSSGSIG